MAGLITNRQDFKSYCLRRLGFPVIEINVDDDQLDDRIDEALQYWTLYHYEGIDEMYLKQQIRASEIVLTTSVASNFILPEIVTGQTSGATASVCKETVRTSSGTLLLVRKVTGTFIPGETIIGSSSNQSAVISTITLGEYDKRYMESFFRIGMYEKGSFNTKLHSFISDE